MRSLVDEPKQMTIFRNIILVLMFLLSSGSVVIAQSISAQEIVAKHLNSIGPESERKALKNLILRASVRLSVHGSNAFVADGNAVLASELNKMIFRLAIQPPATTHESVLFDGTEIRVGRPELKYIRPDFEQFISEFQPMATQGLLGGVLFTGWCLNDLDERDGKIEFGGTDTIDGRKVYVLRYKPKVADSVKIKFYFDAETFVHKRSEIRLTAPRIRNTLAGGPPPPNLDGRSTSGGFPVRGDIAGPTTDTITFVEDFTNFKQEGKLILPHKYTMRIKAQNVINRDSEYVIDVKEVYQNQPLDPKTFDIPN